MQISQNVQVFFPIEICTFMDYSVPFCSINSVSSMFTLKQKLIQQLEVHFTTRMMGLINKKKKKRSGIWILCAVKSCSFPYVAEVEWLTGLRFCITKYLCVCVYIYIYMYIYVCMYTL